MAHTTFADFSNELEEALDELDDQRAHALLDGMDMGGLSEDELEKTTCLLKSHRSFSLLERVGSFAAALGHANPAIQSRWAQALIELGRLRDARTVLRRLVASPDLSGHFRSEALGLLGRSHKQAAFECLSCSSADRDGQEHVRLAMDYYREGQAAAPDDDYWHATNLVAVAEFAKKHGAQNAVLMPSDLEASAILQRLGEPSDSANSWHAAQAMEMAYALQDRDQAMRWLHCYVSNAKTDAFALESTRRQFAEIWRAQECELGDDVLYVLHRESLKHPGTSFLFPEGYIAERARTFESQHSVGPMVHAEWVQKLVATFSRTACIVGENGKGQGSGFVFDGAAVGPEYAGRRLLVTSAHVLSANPADEPHLGDPNRAYATFPLAGLGTHRVSLRNKVFYSPRDTYDVWIADITDEGASPEPTKIYPTLRAANLRPEDRVFVTGFANGKTLKVSIFGSSGIRPLGSHVYYRSPTQSGVSGGPVMDEFFRAFAVHQGAELFAKLNKGILMESVVKQMQLDVHRPTIS